MIATRDGQYRLVGFDIARSSVEGALHLGLEGGYGPREITLPPMPSPAETTSLTLDRIDINRTDIAWTPSGTADMACYTTNVAVAVAACCGDDTGTENARTGGYLRVFLYRVWELAHREDAGVSFTVWQASTAGAMQW